MKNLFSFPSNHFCNLSCNPHFQIIEESVLILLYEVLDRQLVHLTGSTASSFLYHFYQHTQILVDFIYIILVRLLWTNTVKGKWVLRVHPCIIQIWSFQSSDVQWSVLSWSAVWKWNDYLVFWKLPLSPSSEDIVMSDIANSYPLHLHLCSPLHCLDIYCAGSREQSLADRLHTQFFFFAPFLRCCISTLWNSMYCIVPLGSCPLV